MADDRPLKTKTATRRATAASPEHLLRRRDLASWSLVALIGTMMMVPLNALIPAFYAKNTATSLAAIGTVLLLARLYDAVADPTIGYLSDRTRSPLGRRKPWIIGGGLLACVATYLLFNPAPTATGAYFLPVILLFYTSYSMMSVPHSGWGSELSRAYEERSLISGVLTFAGVVGLLLFMGLPLLLSSPLLPLFKTAEITPPMLRLLSWLLIVLAPFCVLVPALTTPRGLNIASHKPKLADLLKSLRLNRPFWIFLAAYGATGLGYGVYYGTAYLFLDSYLGLADKFPLVYALGAICQMVSIPLWTHLAERYERSRIWAFGIAAFGLLLPLQLLLPHGAKAFPFMVGLVVLESFANAASQVPQMAVISDCIDYGLLKTGANLAGSYNALQQFVLKATLAAGGAIGFFILSLVRYDAKTAHHTATSLHALGLVHTLLPLCLFSLSGLFLWSFPLNRRRQMIIRRRIESRSLALESA